MSTIKGLVATAIGVLMLIIAFVVIPVIGSSVEEAVSIQDNSAATGTITFGTGPGVANESINISTETYKLVSTYSAPFDVEIGDGSASAISANLTAEITANSTLVSAVNGTGSVTVTALVEGTAGNAYATTTNVTDASWASATLTGAVDGSQWNANVNSDIPTGYDTWTDLAGLIKVSAILLIISGLFMTFKGMKT